MNLLFTLLLFQDVSGGELILVLLAVFMLFGPKKMPEIAKGIAKGLSKLNKATSDIRKEVNDVIDPIKKELNEQTDNLKNDLNIEDRPSASNLKPPLDTNNKPLG